MKDIKLIVKDTGTEEVFNIDPVNDPHFEETLGEIFCRIFDAERVDYSIQVYDLIETENDLIETEDDEEE